MIGLGYWEDIVHRETLRRAGFVQFEKEKAKRRAVLNAVLSCLVVIAEKMEPDIRCSQTTCMNGQDEIYRYCSKENCN